MRASWSNTTRLLMAAAFALLAVALCHASLWLSHWAAWADAKNQRWYDSLVPLHDEPQP